MENLHVPSLNTELMDIILFALSLYARLLDSEFNPHLEHIEKKLKYLIMWTGERKVDLGCFMCYNKND